MLFRCQAVELKYRESMLCSGIEVVITGLTRNRYVGGMR